MYSLSVTSVATFVQFFSGSAKVSPESPLSGIVTSPTLLENPGGGTSKANIKGFLKIFKNLITGTFCKCADYCYSSSRGFLTVQHLFVKKPFSFFSMLYICSLTALKKLLFVNYLCH
jgi:hypothetical protein